MAKRTNDPRQMGFDAILWDDTVPRPLPAVAGGMDLDQAVRGLLREALKRSKLSRDQIADRVSDLTGRKYTKAHLDAWCGESRTAWQIPAHLVPALEAALGEPLITDWLAALRGGKLITGREIDEWKLGKIEAENQRLRKTRKWLNERLR
ncbi:MAG: hypothetical protein OEV94_11940 [Deltaproteobacteria bacterium]|nr:hypothetical protein [Deltaproteobacteria bacterium]